MTHTELTKAVLAYMDEVSKQHASGIAREHAYRPAQIALFNTVQDTLAVNDAAKTDAGFPDFTFLRRSQTELARGYGEGKDLGENLDKIEKSKQMVKYTAEYGNMLLTNVIEFRFYRAGAQYRPALVIGSINKKTGALVMDRSVAGTLADALEDFLAQTPEKIRSAPRLASIMAGKARVIRDLTKRLLRETAHSDHIAVKTVYASITSILSRDMSPDDFADMYAQTMVYGLFAARFHDESPEDFSRQEARELIAEETEFLRSFFDHIAGATFPTDLKIVVNELCAVLAVSDVRAIVTKHLLREGDTEGKDPIIHFYELFLREYDAEQRKDRGVYYTPTPVVRYIVRAIDRALVEHFGISEGLACADKRTIQIDIGEAAQFKSKRKKNVIQERQVHKVQVLDPAVGTATFLNETVKNIHARFKGQEGMWPAYARDDLMPRLFGFELMMAPYAIAHLKLAMTMADLGAPKSGAAGVFLTNTLEEPAKLNPTLLDFAGLTGAITREASRAAEVKVEHPIMVIMGNPPYSGHSENRFPYADDLPNRYKVEPGGQVPLKERNSKWLKDDYVKFIAYSEAMIARNPDGGVLGMITNNGYLDNPTFRGMRWHLAKTFDTIYVLDLHGSMKKRETAADTKDENVFDIQQGVAIVIAVKDGSKAPNTLAEIKHADLYGTRKQKFEALDKDEIEFDSVSLDPKFLFFQKRSTEGQAEYEAGIPVLDFFHKNVIGLFTGRDRLTIDIYKEAIVKRVDAFRQAEPESAREMYQLGKDVRDWRVEWAQRDLNTDFDPAKFTQITYRPFDVRWTYYTGNSRGFYYYPRDEVMKSLKDDTANYALVLGRQGSATGSGEWTLAYVARHVIDLNIFRRGGGMVLPLRSKDKEGDWFSNVNENTITRFAVNLHARPEPAAVFDYVYGVLNSTAFRASAREFLRSDFPVIPIPKDSDEFERMSEFGKRVRDLHLLEASDLHGAGSVCTTFPVAGNNEITSRRYEDGRLWINDTQYVDGVTEAAWQYEIGGYQVIDKWLKDRKGRQLSADELRHVQRAITAITKVLEADSAI